jgi:hypothetical protein
MFRVKGGLYLKPFLGVGQILLIMGKTFTLTGEWRYIKYGQESR